MSKLVWLVDWMLEDDKSRPSAEARAWRAACVRNAKWFAFAVCAAFALWLFGQEAASQKAKWFEGSATVLWIGDASTDQGAPAYNGHASASHHIWQDGARLQLDGFSEPVLYTTGPNRGLRELMVGDKVHVRYKRGTWLFWEEMVVADVKLDRRPGAEPTR